LRPWRALRVDNSNYFSALKPAKKISERTMTQNKTNEEDEETKRKEIVGISWC
jgi:hypothetical protein